MKNLPAVYILKSQKDARYYYGSTKDLQSRLKRHNSGSVPSTKNRRPLVLHYSENFASYGEALQREKFFKTIAGYNWLKEKRII